MNKEGSTKNVNFKTPGAGVLVLRRGHVTSIVKMLHSLKKSRSLMQNIDQANYVYSYNERVYQNLRYHDP